MHVALQTRPGLDAHASSTSKGLLASGRCPQERGHRPASRPEPARAMTGRELDSAGAGRAMLKLAVPRLVFGGAVAAHCGRASPSRGVSGPQDSPKTQRDSIDEDKIVEGPASLIRERMARHEDDGV
jgi:hypothetical protein